ncbi:TetR/AcrR family transcriptional regulator [Zavarzinia sp.]|uniref:TetR/AcrR family transcriptional regulator n=1 Tax=Zavarzinia sp. TaxID=2027920 RepID=UPI0035632209
MTIANAMTLNDTSAAERAEPGIRQRQKAARPGQFIEAAFAEFSEKGYAATRLEDVARRVGVSKGTIYHYFPGKEDLFKAMVLAHLLPLIDGMKMIAEAKDVSGRFLLETLVDRAYDDLVGNPKSREFLRLMVGEASRVPELAQFFFRELSNRGADLILSVIDRGAATGEFRPDAAAILAASPDAILAAPILASLQAIIMAQIGVPVPEVSKLKAAHLQLLLYGLVKRD